MAAAQPDSSDDSTTTTAASALSRQPAKVKVFATSFIWTETRVLLRILYKSKNKHRQAGFFHRLSLVKRLLGRLFLMEQWICGNAHGDHSNKDDNGDDGDEDDSAINKGTPRASSEVDFLGYLLATTHLCDSIVEACNKAAHSLYQYWCILKVFIPLTSTCFAIMARLRMLVSDLKEAIECLYAMRWRKADSRVRGELEGLVGGEVEPKKTKSMRPKMLLDFETPDGADQKQPGEPSKAKRAKGPPQTAAKHVFREGDALVEKSMPDASNGGIKTKTGLPVTPAFGKRKMDDDAPDEIDEIFGDM